MAVSAVAGIVSAVASAAAASGGFFAALFSVAGAKAFAIGAGLSMISRALAPKPNIGAQMRGITTTTREPASSRKIIYGRMRVGGQVVFISHSGEDNKYLHLAIAFASHEIQAYDEIWFNDNRIWTASGGFQGDWGTYVTIDRKFGTAGQSASTQLVNANSRWTTDHKLSGIAYIAFRLEWDQDKFPQGVPNITATIRGKKVYDPRTQTIAYSQNPALCVRDYMISEYGLDEVAANINDTSVSDAADLCDESVSLDGGGTQDRYQCNGVIDTANQIKANIEQLLSSMGGRLTYSGGEYFIDGAEYKTPSHTFTEADVISDIQTQTKQSRRGIYNGVKGIFVSEEKNYKVLDYPAQISSTYEAEDGDPIYLDMPLPCVTNNTQAQRLAKIALLKSRQQVVMTLTVNLKGLNVKVGDTIQVTNDRLNYSSKVFEVIDYSLAITDGALAVNLSCIETASAIYDWTTSDEADFLSGGELPLYDGRTVENVTSLTMTEIGLRGPDGGVKSAVELSWTAPTDAFVEFYTVRYNKTGTTDYFEVQTRETNALLEGLDISSNYDFRVKAQNLIGVRSSGTSLTNQALNGDQTAPSAPTNGAATGGIQTITAEWSNPTDIDFKHVEVFVNTTNSIPATPTAVVDGEEYIVTGLSGASTRYFWLKSVDFSGNKSSATASFSGTSVVASSSDIGTGAVGSGQIATGAVGTPELGDNSVTITKIADTLQSTNYVAATSGWKLTTDGTFEAGDGTFRGTITSTGGTIGGFTLGSTSLTAGTGSNAVGIHTVKGIYLGATTFSSAPFRVNTAGEFTATNATITGSITATSLTLSGTSIAESQLAQGVQDSLGLADSASQVNQGLALLLNQQSNGTSNVGEAALVGVDKNGVPENIDGFIIYNGDKITVERAQYSTDHTILTAVANKRGFICFDANKTEPFTTTSYGNFDVVFAWKEGDQWYYDENRTTGVTFTPSTITGTQNGTDGTTTPKLLAIGWLETSTSDLILTGGLFEPIALESAPFAGDTYNSGTIGGIEITGSYIQSSNFSSGSAGFKLESNGNLEAGNGTFRGAITATSITLEGTSIAESQLESGVQSSLGLADSAVQDGDTGVNLGLDDGSIAGISINSTKLYAGTGTWANSNTGFYLDNTGKFSLKDKFFYNPSNNLLTVDGNITADVITAKENLVVLGDLEASSMAAGSITRAMFSQDALDEIYGALATSVGGSNGDYKEASGSFTSSGGTVTVGTSSDKFDHGTADVVVEFLANTYFYTTTDYSLAQAQATLNFEVSADGTFTDLTSATKTQVLQFGRYDLTSYYGYTYLVYFFNGEHSKTFTTGSGNDIPDSTELQFRVRVTGVGTAFTSQTIPFTVEANEGVTGVVSTGGNADTLDNLDSTKFLRSDIDDTFDANLTITGNLTVQGTQTTLNTATLNVEDKNIVLNYGAGDTSGSANGAGITIQDAVNSSTDATILWNATTDKFDFSHGIDVTGATTLDGWVYVNVAGNNLVLQSDSLQRETIQWTQNNVNRWKLNLQADGDLDFVPADTADKLLYNNNEIATQSWVTSQGYATSVSETDTLATVTGRGASTSNDITLTGNLILDPTGDDNLRFVADNDAYQRADARNDDTNYARVHWYGKENDLSTSNFRHAWYDGDSYVNVTAEDNGVTFGGGVKSTSTVEAVYLRATSTGDAGASSTTHGLQVGPTSGGNVIIDGNEVMARNNGSTSELNLNPDGGNITFRSNASGTTNLTMSGTTFLDQSRNATLNTISCGQITSSGSITAGNASTSLGYYVGSTQVIQGSTRNLVNIGTIGSGSITSSGTVTADRMGYNAGNYAYLSQTSSGATTVLGHNVRAHASVNNRADTVNGNWHGHAIAMYYDRGISFYTTSGTVAAGTTVFSSNTDQTNLRMRIAPNGDFDFRSGAFSNVGGIAITADTTITGGRLTITDDTNALRLRSTNNGVGVNINFSDHQVGSYGQQGNLNYVHQDGSSYGSGNAFIFSSTESTMTILADGKLMFKEGLYIKPSSGTGAGTQIIDSSRNLTIVNATVSGISNHQRDVRSARQVRAAGWYNESASTNYTGLAFEIGQSGGTCFALAYNRATNSYGPMAFAATSFKFNNHVQFGDGTQSNASDANITINEGNAFAGIDLKSTRTAGNIGGIRSYNSSNSITNQLLFRVDGYVNLLNSNGFAINNVTRIDGDGDATFKQLTTSSLITLTAGSGFNQYTENGAYINWDVRDSGSTARVHNWARNSAGTAYAPYYENWYDGGSYYSIGIEGGAWRIGGNAFISGALSVGGNFSTRSGYLMHAKSTGPCRLLLEADSDNVTETDTVQIRMEQDGSAVNARMGFTANNDFEIVNEYASYFYLGGNNNYRFRLDNSGNVIVNGNVTAYGSASDQRLKSDIEVIPDALEKVMTLDGVTFNYIGEEERMTGLIAQQVEAVLPEAVYETSSIEDDETSYKALHYGNIVGLTVEAIKELKRENDELKDLVKQLMQKLEK